MVISDRKFFHADFIFHNSRTSKVAAGILTGTVLIVAIWTAYRPAEALSAVDSKDIKLMRARQINGAPSNVLAGETNPAWYELRSPKEAAPGFSLQENKDVEASMINGHIQAF